MSYQQQSLLKNRNFNMETNYQNEKHKDGLNQGIDDKQNLKEISSKSFEQFQNEIYMIQEEQQKNGFKKSQNNISYNTPESKKSVIVKQLSDRINQSYQQKKEFSNKNNNSRSNSISHNTRSSNSSNTSTNRTNNSRGQSNYKKKNKKFRSRMRNNEQKEIYLKENSDNNLTHEKILISSNKRNLRSSSRSQQSLQISTSKNLQNNEIKQDTKIKINQLQYTQNSEPQNIEQNVQNNQIVLNEEKNDLQRITLQNSRKSFKDIVIIKQNGNNQMETTKQLNVVYNNRENIEFVEQSEKQQQKQLEINEKNIAIQQNISQNQDHNISSHFSKDLSLAKNDIHNQNPNSNISIDEQEHFFINPLRFDTIMKKQLQSDNKFNQNESFKTQICSLNRNEQPISKSEGGLKKQKKKPKKAYKSSQINHHVNQDNSINKNDKVLCSNSDEYLMDEKRKMIIEEQNSDKNKCKQNLSFTSKINKIERLIIPETLKDNKILKDITQNNRIQLNQYKKSPIIKIKIPNAKLQEDLNCTHSTNNISITNNINNENNNIYINQTNNIFHINDPKLTESLIKQIPQMENKSKKSVYEKRKPNETEEQSLLLLNNQHIKKEIQKLDFNCLLKLDSKKNDEKQSISSKKNEPLQIISSQNVKLQTNTSINNLFQSNEKTFTQYYNNSKLNKNTIEFNKSRIEQNKSVFEFNKNIVGTTQNIFELSKKSKITHEIKSNISIKELQTKSECQIEDEFNEINEKLKRIFIKSTEQKWETEFLFKQQLTINNEILKLNEKLKDFE